jgi:hypothetical protein
MGGLRLVAEEQGKRDISLASEQALEQAGLS